MKIGLGRVGDPAVTSTASKRGFQAAFTGQRRPSPLRELVRVPSPVTPAMFVLRRMGY